MAHGLDGAVMLDISGKPRRLAFTWEALAELQTVFGDDFQERINDAMAKRDFRVLAVIIEVASGREVTAAEVMRSSPPIVATLQGMARAISLAYHGPDGPEAREDRPLAQMAAGISRMFRAPMSFVKRLLRGLKSNAAGRSS